MVARPAHAEAFQTLRPALLALAYRMLGDLARAEDIIQDAWLRWQQSDVEADSPKAYLSTIVTRLCLNELGSARARREATRSDRLPEPIDLATGGIDRIEQYERISMAFMVLLQRLTPVERAVFLLHEVFEQEHTQIAELVGRSVPACRKLLERAREGVAAGRKLITASRDEHQRLLRAFLEAASAGDVTQLAALLADDAQLITDGGPNGRFFEGLRNLTQPLQGANNVARFVIHRTAQSEGILEREERELNGQPALVLLQDGAPFAALLLGIADGKIHSVYFHADPTRLQHLGDLDRGASGRDE
ncbi:MAG: sigma-70 family RNA polymerase sigma factor [Polyangiales bacterium]